MPSGRFTRVAAFTVAAVLCVSAGIWLAPRVRSGGGATGGAPQPPTVDAFRAEPGTALLNVLPPRGSTSDATDAAWQRTIATHAARIARPEVFGEVVGDAKGAAARTRWHAPPGTPAHAGAVAGLRRATSVRVVPGTSLIAVRVDVEPAADAAALTNEICRVYLKACREADDTFSAFHGKQAQLDRLLEERGGLSTLLAEQEMRLNGLSRETAEGKIPAEFRWQVREHPEYQRASERLHQAEAELDATAAAAAGDAEALAGKEKQRDARRERLERLRKELTAELLESRGNEFNGRREELQAQAQRLDRLLDDHSQEMAEVGRQRSVYGMTHISRNEINALPTAVEWTQKATVGP